MESLLTGTYQPQPVLGVEIPKPGKNKGVRLLGIPLLRNGKLVIASHSVERVKDKIRGLTRRNRGVSIEKVISELNEKLRGRVNYFRLTEWPSDLTRLDTWIRRKRRCYRLKQRKHSWPIAKFLMNLGVPANSAWNLARSGKGWWRLSKSIPAHHAMNNAWFDEKGLINLSKQRALLNV